MVDSIVVVVVVVVVVRGLVHRDFVLNHSDCLFHFDPHRARVRFLFGSYWAAMIVGASPSRCW